MSINLTYGGRSRQFEISRQLDDVKLSIIRKDLPSALKAGQQKGFPTNPKDYQLLVRNRGRVTRRKMSTLNSSFLKIGTVGSPLQFTFTAGVADVEIIYAAIDALKMMESRAPIRSGKYFNSLGITLNGRPIRAAALKRAEIDASSTIYVGPGVYGPVPYAAVIEKGFYKKYYRTRSIPGGIIRPVARMIRSKYGDSVAARFAYTGAGGGTAPAVIISSLAGSGIGRDSVPGRSRRRR